MFKLPNLPSPQADPHELADFVELLSWRQGSASKREIVAYLGRIDDNDDNEGCNDDDDENSAFLDEVMNEVERRAMACGTGYPFDCCLEGTVLRHRANDQCKQAVVYRYLLLGTRLNMTSNRVHAGIDGTLLFEEISAEAIHDYLGDHRARSFVFGTATAGNFPEKVDSLCRELKEGGGFKNRDFGSVEANDDKLDAVAWVPFSDGLPGQLIVFGQCKTGSNWGGLTTQLQPDAFIKRWMQDPIVVNPVRAFCISEAANRSKWKGICSYAGILMDRCRIVDFCDNLPSDLLDRVQSWTTAAMSSDAIGAL